MTLPLGRIPAGSHSHKFDNGEIPTLLYIVGDVISSLAGQLYLKLFSKGVVPKCGEI